MRCFSISTILGSSLRLGGTEADVVGGGEGVEEEVEEETGVEEGVGEGEGEVELIGEADRG